MNWRNHITSDKGILGGKPIIKGTRLSVEFILGLFAESWPQERILKNYPSLTKDNIKAIFAFVQERNFEPLGQQKS